VVGGERGESKGGAKRNASGPRPAHLDHPLPSSSQPREIDARQRNYATVNLSLSLSLSRASGAFLLPRGRWSASDKINGGRARSAVGSRNLSRPWYIYYRRTRADNRLELLVAATTDLPALFLIILSGNRERALSTPRYRRSIEFPHPSPPPHFLSVAESLSDCSRKFAASDYGVE
jgi:hypothetical protein